jgi:60 kDa SS-A/Ro ribonucleoprotein
MPSNLIRYYTQKTYEFHFEYFLNRHDACFVCFPSTTQTANICCEGKNIMASKSLFKSLVGMLAPKAEVQNEAGGTAYSFSDQHKLAQYAATGCLNQTFYASADQQLATVLELCAANEPEFIARTALFARSKGAMKDMPALLCAVLSVRSPGLLAEIFDRVIDSPKMLRNFVQIMRSGVVGRKSLGTLPKRLILQWLENRTDEQLFSGSVGNDPSLADVIKMVHPKPKSPSREALYAYLIGRAFNEDALPEIVKQYEAFKQNTNAAEVAAPDVPFQMLTALPLTKTHWQQIARNASWTMTRMNLNTFVRQGVFEDQDLIAIVANRLRDANLIEKAKVFPYQLLTAWMSITDEVPRPIRDALQDAMEIAIRNVPQINGQVYVFPDISGSMHSPVTGHRAGSTTAAKCIDIAALVAATVMRNNPQTVVVPFSDNVTPCQLNPRDSVMTNAAKLMKLPSGGTNCSAPLAHLNAKKAKGDLVIYVSDNESWIDSSRHAFYAQRATETMTQWMAFKQRNPQAKMICIDIQPYGTTQAKESSDIINVGGFSDHVFQLIADVAGGRFSENHWVNEISQMRI